METRQWWFKIETHRVTVKVLFIQHGSLHIMCNDLMSEEVINFRIQGV